jgi:hypothetical protein
MPWMTPATIFDVGVFATQRAVATHRKGGWFVSNWRTNVCIIESGRCHNPYTLKNRRQRTLNVM